MIPDRHGKAKEGEEGSPGRRFVSKSVEVLDTCWGWCSQILPTVQSAPLTRGRGKEGSWYCGSGTKTGPAITDGSSKSAGFFANQC